VAARADLLRRAGAQPAHLAALALVALALVALALVALALVALALVALAPVARAAASPTARGRSEQCPAHSARASTSPIRLGNA